MNLRTQKYLVLLCILTITLAVKYPIIQNGFINRDDPAYITENPFNTEFSLSNTARIFSTPDYMADYHPLTLTFFSLEYSFFGDNPRGYHGVSLFLDLLITSMVFFVISRLSGSTPVAGVTALLFGIHPTHIESVAWASEQKDLLYGFFYLASLLAYLRYSEREGFSRYYYLSLFCFILALLSKMMAAPLALVIPLCDYLLRRPPTRKILIEKIPYLALAVGFGLYELAAHREIGAMMSDISYGPVGRIALAAEASIRYIGQLVGPSHLSAYYPFPFPPGDTPVRSVLFVILALVLLSGTLYSLRSTRTVFFGVAFFLLNISLLLHFLPAVGAFMADRYTYIASIGLFYIVGEVIVRMYRKYRSMQWVIASAGALIVLALGSYSRSRTYEWRDAKTLWTDAIEKYPYVAFIYVYRANARPPSEYDPALADLRQAIELQPDLGIAYYSRGYLEALHGNHAAAIQDYSRSIDLRYQTVKSYANRGSSYTSAGKFKEAISDFTRAIELNDRYADALFNRGNVYLTIGEFSNAIADYDRTIALNPLDGESYYNRATAKFRIGDRDRSCQDFKIAETLKFPSATDAIRTYCK